MVAFTWMVRFIGLGMLAIVAACSRTAGPEPRAEPMHSMPMAQDAATAGLDRIDAGPIFAWTDNPAITALARSCAFEPPRDSSAQSRPGPLSCALRFEQACVADPCFHDDEENCKAECVTTCEGCGASCVTACDGCKSTCTDDACRRKCAVSCGQCRQGCLATRDRCSTGHCTDVYKECRKKLVSSWLEKNCDAACAVCTAKCGDGECTCWEKNPVAAACHANPMLCPEMFMAPERRELDPKWRANHCEDVCTKVWACAKTECEKAQCAEPVKMFDRCSLRTAGARVCGVIGLAGLTRCQEALEE